MGKCTVTILNRIVEDAAGIIESKIEFCECVAEQFENQGKNEDAARWRENIPDMKIAIGVIRRMSGSWA